MGIDILQSLLASGSLQGTMTPGAQYMGGLDLLQSSAEQEAAAARVRADQAQEQLRQVAQGGGAAPLPGGAGLALAGLGIAQAMSGSPLLGLGLQSIEESRRQKSELHAEQLRIAHESADQLAHEAAQAGDRVAALKYSTKALALGKQYDERMDTLRQQERLANQRPPAAKGSGTPSKASELVHMTDAQFAKYIQRLATASQAAKLPAPTTGTKLNAVQTGLVNLMRTASTRADLARVSQILAKHPEWELIPEVRAAADSLTGRAAGGFPR